jgi:hypothetical protein
MNPDGAEAFFGKLKTGKKTNSNPFDADNDGRMDEDNPDDLNGDGQITVFRVKDPNGLYRIDPDEPMLMKKADAAKGERGEYSIYPEGIDNDKDGFINEDLSGGTDINRNFMHAYPYFKENAGKYMVSENETRALLDWMLVHRNIAMVLTFGESDNLITAPSSRGTLSSDRPLDLVNFANATIAGAGRVGMVSAGGGRGFGRYGGMMFGDFPMAAVRDLPKPQRLRSTPLISNTLPRQAKNTRRSLALKPSRFSETLKEHSSSMHISSSGYLHSQHQVGGSSSRPIPHAGDRGPAEQPGWAEMKLPQPHRVP